MRMPSFVNKVSVPAFSYSVTREYPYKWFTPVAIVGGILLTVLFSAINFYSTAYTMVTTTTPYRESFLSRRWPRYIPEIFTSKIQPRCDPSVIPAHSYFQTNQSGFTYELYLAGPQISDTALSYSGGLIEECTVEQVRITFETSSSRSPAQRSTSDWEVTVSSWIRCVVEHRTIYLITRYGPMSTDIIDSKVSLPTGFYAIFLTATPGLYWADQLLTAFWLETLVAITNQTIQESAAGTATPWYNLSSGFIDLISDQSSEEIDIKDESFFSRVEWAFLDQARGQKYTGLSGDEELVGLVGNKSWPNVWSEVDRLGKAMVSANYLDLGQLQLPSKTNMFSTPESLQFWTANFSTIREKSPDWLKVFLSSDRGWSLLNNDDIQKQIEPTWSPNTTTSVIAATYMCQDPVLKSWANVFVSILVADLVFLRAAWSLYNLIVGYFLKSRHPDANICEDCLARKKEEDSLAKQPTTSTIASTGMSEEVIEMNHLPAQRPSAGQYESTQSLLTHRNEESQSLLEVEERHATNDTGPLVVRTSPLGS